MKRYFVALGLATLAVALPQLARAQGCPSSQLIDDFSTGKHKVSLRTGFQDDVQKGAMIGGRRFTRFSVCNPAVPGECDVTNLYNQLEMLEIRPVDSVLVVDAAIRGFFRLEVFYGLDLVQGQPVLAPLNLDLSCFSKFRVHFDASDLVVNFNMQVTAGNNPGVPAQQGFNTDPITTPTVIEFPFTDFVPNADPPPNFSDIDLVTLIFQSGSAIGANDFAVTKIEAVP